MSDVSSIPSPAVPRLREIFFAFQTCALHAFGGVLPFARRELVDTRRWLSEEEFTEILGLCQFLPGPNISNLAIAVGSRFRGIPGALMAFLGLYLMPLVIVLSVATVYAHYGTLPALQGALDGIAAAAAGLILAMALKMGRPLWRQRRWLSLGFTAATVLAVGVFSLPLLWVLPTLALVGVAVARPAP